jgi:hypothetical protein
MVSVTMKLGMSALSGAGSWIILLLALVIVIAWNVNAAFVVLGSGLMGWLFTQITW